LRIQTCNACGTHILYPRHRCISCGSNDLGWTVASGRGVLHTFTVVRAVPPEGFEDELPYGLGVVKLEEGVQLMARLWPADDGSGWDSYACNSPVVFTPSDAASVEKRPIAWFAPAPV
ncbi:MAG: OB-fold domain-containing protein, partial [Gemmobacter sp.]|nr:OB-fold domain-containing protein [Gemmobacter sp.]